MIELNKKVETTTTISFEIKSTDIAKMIAEQFAIQHGVTIDPSDIDFEIGEDNNGYYIFDKAAYRKTVKV